MSGVTWALCVVVFPIAAIVVCVLLSHLARFRWYRKFRGGKWGKYKTIFGDWCWERIEQEEMEDYTQMEVYE